MSGTDAAGSTPSSALHTCDHLRPIVVSLRGTKYLMIYKKGTRVSNKFFEVIRI